MEFGIGYFPTHDAASPGAVARLVEERGHESLFFAEHTHIPASPRDPLPGRRRAAAQIQPHLRPLRRADRGRRGDLAAARRQRHLPGRRARPDHDRQRGRLGRPPLRRALRVRRRRRLEPRGDGQPRHRPAHAHAADGRAGRGDEGDLDRGRGELPRRVRRLRPDLVLAEARPAPAPAGPGRRQRADRARPRARLRRRLDAEQHRRRPDRPRRGAARPRRAADRLHGDGRPRRPGVLEQLREAGCRRVVRWVPSTGTGGIERALERWESAIAEFTGEA